MSDLANGTNDSVHIAPSAFAQFDRRQDTGFGFVRLNSSQNGLFALEIALVLSKHLWITTAEPTFGSGYVTLNGNQTGGIQVTIANNAFATITPPRIGGGWVFLTTRGTMRFRITLVLLAWLDWGNSHSVSCLEVIDVDTSTSGPPTGTTGTAGKVTFLLVALGDEIL